MSEKNPTKELYDKVKYLVSDYAELSEDDILTSNKEECVNARYIMIGILGDYLTDEEIARCTGLTRACANKIRNGMRAKMNRFSFRCLYESVKITIRNEYATK